jgi:uncharacterized protein
MKIAIYGATGMVGSPITAEALRRGHEVAALSRKGTRVAGATAVAASLDDLKTFQDVAATNDAVVIAIPPPRTGEPHEPFLAAHRAIAASKVPARVFVVGGAGATEVNGVKLVDLPGFPAAYAPEARTMSAVLDLYRASKALRWTMLAPAPVIAPGERTGKYELGKDSPAGERVSTQDFAVAVLDELENPRHVNERFTVAS